MQGCHHRHQGHNQGDTQEVLFNTENTMETIKHQDNCFLETVLLLLLELGATTLVVLLLMILGS